MSFVICATSASSAVATNGTFTVAAPSATLAGAIKSTGGHYFVVHGMAARFNYPVDWTVTWSGATATITYLGTTSIPAGSAINVQFEYESDDTNFPYHNKNSGQLDTSGASYQGYRGSFGQVFRVDFGAPLAAAATTLLATRALSTTTVTTLTAAEQVTATTDIPRTVAVKSSSASDDNTKTITLRGFDEYGAAMTETITMNGVTAVLSLKAWKRIVSMQASVTFVGTLSIGINAGGFGLPYFISGQGTTTVAIGSVLKESQDGTTPTAGTVVPGVLTTATATTGDVRGTYSPNTAPDGSKICAIYMFVGDPSFLGAPQYSA